MEAAGSRRAAQAPRASGRRPGPPARPGPGRPKRARPRAAAADTASMRRVRQGIRRQRPAPRRRRAHGNGPRKSPRPQRRQRSGPRPDFETQQPGQQRQRVGGARVPEHRAIRRPRRATARASTSTRSSRRATPTLAVRATRLPQSPRGNGEGSGQPRATAMATAASNDWSSILAQPQRVRAAVRTRDPGATRAGHRSRAEPPREVDGDVAARDGPPAFAGRRGCRAGPPAPEEEIRESGVPGFDRVRGGRYAGLGSASSSMKKRPVRRARVARRRSRARRRRRSRACACGRAARSRRESSRWPRWRSPCAATAR